MGMRGGSPTEEVRPPMPNRPTPRLDAANEYLQRRVASMRDTRGGPVQLRNNTPSPPPPSTASRVTPVPPPPPSSSAARSRSPARGAKRGGVEVPPPSPRTLPPLPPLPSGFAGPGPVPEGFPQRPPGMPAMMPPNSGDEREPLARRRMPIFPKPPAALPTPRFVPPPTRPPSSSRSPSEGYSEAPWRRSRPGPGGGQR